MARQPSTAPITFVVPGQRQATRGAAAASIPGLPGRVKENVRMAARRAGGEHLRVTAVPGEDVVVLHIAGGPPLLLHPENARDLLLGQGSAKRSARAGRRRGGRAGAAALAGPGAGRAHAHAAASWATWCCRPSRCSPAWPRTAR